MSNKIGSGEGVVIPPVPEVAVWRYDEGHHAAVKAGYGGASAIRAGLEAACPWMLADAMRWIAQEIERDGGTILTATWAADVLRERADQLEERDHA